MSTQYILALDLGTTGNRALVFDHSGAVIAQAYQELTQHYPQPAWVEHDASEIWADTQTVMKQAIADAKIEPSQIAAMGLTVQRETCVLWDKTTGQPLHNAIVWQDRRTADLCNKLREQGKAPEIQERTGLVLDAYFSASKLSWMLDWVKQNKPDVDLNNVIAGTVDTWVLWNLTGGKVHATDDSNACRTMLYNLKERQWDTTLLDLFNLPHHFMGEIRSSLGDFGKTDAAVCGAEIPVRTIFGDQQAALFAHGCDRPGLLKCTYGTGAFLVAQTGKGIATSKHRLLSTIAWTESSKGTVLHALEGSMFTAGACIQWLRDELKFVENAAETEDLALSVEDNAGVYFVPALSGLGAPHWDMDARGAFFGMTRGSGKAHLIRAVLEAIAFQVRDVVQAVNEDCGSPIKTLKVDGGACQNNFLMQFQADVLGIPVERPVVLDATAQGAAFGAGLASGFWDDYHTLINSRKIDKVFEPSENAATAQANFQTWLKAVERTKNWE
ncbi:glycerol kinase GlpK [filamentous cyanobacterium LEGE 11480]|uniref:Glycerol kinase n=1 Tax=Romeriopsis navalis LEGE 11480 TaxID=2777977 RepID=A0A928Z4S4_9CYAN|nr:glycerol kinase GlpK [Romeriopsis navalis]MBE9031322.1 glycerol kinase GlpK [Romeriopsis navalis LEGE 11480]